MFVVVWMNERMGMIMIREALWCWLTNSDDDVISMVLLVVEYQDYER